MVHLELDEEQAVALREVLETYLGDLSYEIADTDDHDYRERLKARQALLSKALEALRSQSR